MPVPSSGQINVKGIFSELNEDDYTAQNIDGQTDVSFTKLTNGTYATINTANGWSGSDNTSGETGANIASQPHELSEWRGYDHDEAPAFSWGTTSAPSTNMQFIYTMDSANFDASSAISAVIFEFQRSGSTYTWKLKGQIDGNDSGDLSYTTDSETLSYSGTLSSLDVRFTFSSGSGQFTNDTNYTGDWVYGAAAKNNGQLSASGCGGTAATCTGATSTDNLNSHITSSAGFETDWFSMSTGTGIQNMILWAGANGDNQQIQGPTASIGGGTIAIQMRANGSVIKTVHTRSGSSNINMMVTSDDSNNVSDP